MEALEFTQPEIQDVFFLKKPEKRQNPSPSFRQLSSTCTYLLQPFPPAPPLYYSSSSLHLHQPLFHTSLPQTLQTPNPDPSTMASSASNERNRLENARPPTPFPSIPPPGPPASAPARPVYVHELYRAPGDVERREMAYLCRSLTLVLLILLFTAMFAFVVWVILHPNFPMLYVSSAVLSNLTTTTTTATAVCNFTLLLTNTNLHLATIYDHFEIYLVYPSQEVLLSQDFLPPFEQHRKSTTVFESNLSFTGAYLSPDVVDSMKRDLEKGVLGLGVKVFAELRYKNGKYWKTRSQFMRAACGVVIFGFNSSNEVSLNPPIACDVYLYTK